MKKITATAVAVIIFIFTVMPLTVFAWEKPELSLAASYDAQEKTITVFYRLLDFAGTESADFRLSYNQNALEFTDYEINKLSENVMTEVAEMPSEPGKIAIQFIDLYYVEEDECEEDGSATVATLTFKITDETATEAVFISTADSFNMDPDSKEVNLNRATLKISLSEGSTTASTHDYDFSKNSGSSSADETKTQMNEGLKKVIIAAIVTAVVLVAGIAAIVIKYRKQ